MGRVSVVVLLTTGILSLPLAGAAGDRRGDFNGDGREDLAVGVPLEDLAVGVPGKNVGTALEAGGVHVLREGTGGLTTGRNTFWSQEIPGIAGVAEGGDRFGRARGR